MRVLGWLKLSLTLTTWTTTTMPVPTTVQHEKNIWIAAGDGDLERVRVGLDSLSPRFSTAETISAGIDRRPLFVRSPELNRYGMLKRMFSYVTKCTR